jgi:hypothetical protein
MKTEWKDIKTAPIGPVILLSNSEMKTVAAGYGEWLDKAPYPIFHSCDPMGFGRFKATHWAEMPEAA